MFNSTQPTCRADLLIHSITAYAILMLDPDGRITSWNRGAERLNGYKTDEILGKHFSCFYLPEEPQNNLADRTLATALSDGLFVTEGWRIRKDGTHFWASVTVEPVRDEDAHHIGFVMSMRDSTEQMKIEEHLRKSEERFRLLVQGVTDYAIYMLDPDGRISSWNAGAERFKGYSEQEIIGQNFSRFYPPEDRAADLPQKALVTAASQGRFETEGWRLRKDGTQFWAHVVIDPIHSYGGELIGYTKITRDLTERKIAEEALEESQEQLFQAQKMEAIGQLTGSVAHDFNNLLAAIIGSLRLAQRRQDKGENEDIFIKNAIEAAERGATLTQRMLAFARKQELKLEPTDVISSMSGVTMLLEHMIGPGISIRSKFPAEIRPVLTDRAQLELAVMNLMVNARDALGEEGEIVLCAREVDEPDGEGAFVCLSVEDEGEGMDEETLARAMEPFFTTKGVGKGTGLGLSMVKGMVEQSGGRLVLNSKIGQGTQVEIWLPIVDQCVQEPTIPDDPTSPINTKLHVLAVDDDAIVLINTAAVLSDMGYEVLEAHSGKKALEILETEKVDLLLTDFAMPKMSGAELVEKAKALKPDLKVIVASGYAELPDGIRLEAHRLNKPFSEMDLADAITALMR